MEIPPARKRYTQTVNVMGHHFEVFYGARNNFLDLAGFEVSHDDVIVTSLILTVQKEDHG